MKIVVLAGGSDQIALIKELKKRGHHVILVDYFENPPAKSFADQHIVASTLDIQRVKDITENSGAELVCTACTDQALLTVANVSEQLGLPCYISYQEALNVTNKSYMKKQMMLSGIPTAKFAILENSLDLTAIKEFRFPLVVKPVDCNSSKGVVLVNDEIHLCEVIDKAIELSRTNTAIVEEFKEGIEISADFYIENGKAIYLSATSSAKISNRNSFTIMSSIYPAINSEQEVQMTEIASQIASSFNLTNCPLLIQMIVNDDEINIIEFSARMGGGSKYYLIEAITGVDIMSQYVDLILGKKPVIIPEKKIEYCRMNYIYCTPGIMDKVTGLEQLKTDGTIKEYFLYKSSGSEIRESKTSGDRAAGYLVIGGSIEEIKSKVKLADSTINVLDQEGKDIMIHNLV